MVNDGSPDESLDLALKIQETDPRVTVIDLSRNFGHHKALMTGLAHATGDLVFLIDSDLDEEPEVLPLFHRRMLEENCDVVYGVQLGRRGDFIERSTGAVYYRLVEMLSDDKIPRNLITARLMKKRYVSALVRHRDRAFLIAQLWSTSGFNQVSVPVKKLKRSKSTYSMWLRAEYFIKHISTSSTRLLYAIFYFGLFLSLTAFCVTLYYLVRYAVMGAPPGGFAAIFLSILFFGGVIIGILGIQGIYIANILVETKRRPYTVIRKIYKGS
jgi:putative glycosyltransferase